MLNLNEHPRIAEMRQKLREARRAAAVSIGVSGLLGVVKITAGWLGNSHGAVTDGVESAGDAVTSGIVFYALTVAALPPDEEHPYGHSRAEDVAGQAVTVILCLTGLMLLWNNGESLIELFRDPKGALPVAPYMLWLMLASLAVKSVLFGYKRAVGKRLGSIALTADAWHDLADVMAATSVLIGIAFSLAGYLWVDRAVAVLVSLLIMYTGYRISCATQPALLDQQAPPEVLRNLRELARTVPGVAGVEKLMARRAGLTYFVDLHLEVDGAMPVREAHEIGHKVKQLLLEKHADVADVLIHLEPAPPRE